MRIAMVGLLTTAVVLTSGCRSGKSIRAANAKLESIPAGNYPKVDLGRDPSGWNWAKQFGRPIGDVMVDPPIDANGPAQLGKDFSGSFEGDALRIQFRIPGVYAVKIAFQDATIPPEIYLVFVAVSEN